MAPQFVVRSRPSAVRKKVSPNFSKNYKLKTTNYKGSSLNAAALFWHDDRICLRACV